MGLFAGLIALLVVAPADKTAARTLPVYPGTNQISAAVAESAEGDTILLAASGTYVESDRVKPPHSISFLAADSLQIPPLWLGSDARYLRLGGNTHIRGITFDGLHRARHGIKIDQTPLASLVVEDS